MTKRDSDGAGHGTWQLHEMKMYLRFGAMILTAMVVMCATMFASTWE